MIQLFRIALLSHNAGFFVMHHQRHMKQMLFQSLMTHLGDQKVGGSQEDAEENMESEAYQSKSSKQKSSFQKLVEQLRQREMEPCYRPPSSPRLYNDQSTQQELEALFPAKHSMMSIR